MAGSELIIAAMLLTIPPGVPATCPPEADFPALPAPGGVDVASSPPQATKPVSARRERPNDDESRRRAEKRKIMGHTGRRTAHAKGITQREVVVSEGDASRCGSDMIRASARWSAGRAERGSV